VRAESECKVSELAAACQTLALGFVATVTTRALRLEGKPRSAGGKPPALLLIVTSAANF
jgi:hypothetical protein